MTRLNTILFCLIVTLSACGRGVPDLPATPSRPSIPPPQSDTCGAGPHASLIGQERTALERVLIMREIRIVRPGDAVTLDFRPTRLNIEIGTDGRIASLYCG